MDRGSLNVFLFMPVQFSRNACEHRKKYFIFFLPSKFHRTFRTGNLKWWSIADVWIRFLAQSINFPFIDLMWNIVCYHVAISFHIISFVEHTQDICGKSYSIITKLACNVNGVTNWNLCKNITYNSIFFIWYWEQFSIVIQVSDDIILKVKCSTFLNDVK